MATKLFSLLTLLLQSLPAQADPSLGRLSWGIRNEGAPQQILIDHYTAGEILGVAGEDIHLPAPAPQSRKVIVGVLDTGVDYHHPQLKNALAGSGSNIINNTSDASDTHGHGTHISGIIAGREDSKGLRGVSQNAVILPVKVVQTGPNAPIRPQGTEPGVGTALTENVAKGLVYAIQNGAEVINLSLAWPASIHSKKVDEAMALAKEKQVLIVSSAGNDSTLANVYPCIYENVICVGSHGPDGSFSHFSNYGPMVDLLAPGTAILSLWPLNKSPITYAGQVGYEFRNGTSMAAPFVSGALAELLSRGLSPTEAVNRLLLGTRATASRSLFKSDVIQDLSRTSNLDPKATRFGNLDLTHALNLTPSPLILPTQKEIIEIQWDGHSSEIPLSLSFKNRWIKAGDTTITIEDQSFHFDSINENETVNLPYVLHLGKNPESALTLRARVATQGFLKTDLSIGVSLSRTLSSATLPKSALVKSIVGVNPMNFNSVRSVVNADGADSLDTILLKTTKGSLSIALVQEDQFRGNVEFQGFIADQLLNFYRLPNQEYCAIFAKQERGEPRPSFYLKFFSNTLQLSRELKVGTELTVLSENFRWSPHKDGMTPLWISLGFTPKIDLPAFDPWNPKAVDLKMPRVFYLDHSGLRIVKMGKNQLPLQILPDGRILVAEGNEYLQSYSLLSLTDGVVTHSEILTLPSYRMLIGLSAGIDILDLDGTQASSLLLAGNSTPGSLRVSSLGGRRFDEILKRTTTLDSLVSVLGSFTDDAGNYHFAQTHYDLQFFSSRSSRVLVTSLNRYSYIPSMIFSRGFYPAVAENLSGKRLPAIYIPATLANGNISEVVIADPDAERLVRPASLRFQITDPNCVGLGNLLRASNSRPARQVFLCKDQLIEIPLLSDLTSDKSAAQSH